MDILLTDALLYNMYWERANTPEMATRGLVIRRDIPEWINARRDRLAAAMGLSVDDTGIEGRDGTGLKTEIPWVRVFSRSRSPSATAGWYIVYLFSARGDRVYLSLNQGTTSWSGVDFVRKPSEELIPRVAWARAELSALGSLRPDLVTDIQLDARRSDLGPAYELGNVYALAYELDAMPGPRRLEEDLAYMATLLGWVYRAYGRAAFVPGDLSPELFDALSSAERAAGVPGARARGGQGFGLTKEQQGVVEAYAVQRARAHLKEHGFADHYVGDKRTWDIEANKDAQTVFVEVKGTTSPGDSVILTGAQVREYGKRYPHTMLIVVSNIQLDRSASPPAASGGDLATVFPWRIAPDDLDAISWKYSVPSGIEGTSPSGVHPTLP